MAQSDYTEHFVRQLTEHQILDTGQLATTYDVDSQRTVHYLNGEVLHSEMIPDAQLVKTTRIGAASIGNWSLPTKPDARFAIRNLNGRIDEFVMFAAALNAKEVKEIYEHGKP